MITRNDLLIFFKAEYLLNDNEARQIFKGISDLELADIYGLKIIRKGYFVR